MTLCIGFEKGWLKIGFSAFSVSVELFSNYLTNLTIFQVVLCIITYFITIGSTTDANILIVWILTTIYGTDSQ